MESSEAINKKVGNEFDLDLMKERIVSSGKWFFWISLLSVVNIVLYLLKVDVFFVLGMSLPFFIAGLLSAFISSTGLTVVIADLLVVAYFGFMGYLSVKKLKAGFIAGTIVYILDTLLFAYMKQYAAIIWHIIALYMIIRGFISLLKYNKIMLEMKNNVEEAGAI